MLSLIVVDDLWSHAHHVTAISPTPGYSRRYARPAGEDARNLCKRSLRWGSSFGGWQGQKAVVILVASSLQTE